MSSTDVGNFSRAELRGNTGLGGTLLGSTGDGRRRRNPKLAATLKPMSDIGVMSPKHQAVKSYVQIRNEKQ
jgi:hypothetical protein